MKVFVTGGTGFIGRHFLMQAATMGHEIYALCRKLPEESIGGIRWLEGTLREDHHKYLVGCDVVIHLAAAGVSPQAATTAELFSTNVTDSLFFWENAIEAGVRRLIICGSCFEYGRSAERHEFIPPEASLDPVSGYGASKAAATMAALGLSRERKIALTVLRPFHVFGDGQNELNFWPSLRRAALAGHDFPMTLGEQIRDFTPVEDVGRVFSHAISSAAVTGEATIANIGTGRSQTLRSFAEYWWHQWQASGKLKPGVLPYRDCEIMRYVPLISKFNYVDNVLPTSARFA